MIRNLLVVFLLSKLCPVSAQIIPQRDTSFSIYSTYIKTRKQFPDIRIADPKTPDNIKIKEGIKYCRIGGRELKLDIFYPKKRGKDKFPAVLMIHGGGWRSGERSQNTPTAKMLASKGYVAISVEYRLSTEAKYPAAVHDLKTATRWIRSNASRYRINPSKIAAWGTSAGGQLAALLGTTNQDPDFEGNGEYLNYESTVQAVIDVDGTLAFIHPESGEGDDRKSISAATHWFGYSKAERPELWHSAGPLNQVDRLSPPFLFINSSIPRMHAGRDDMIKKLNEFNIYSEVKTIPDAPHPFWLFHPWFEPSVDFSAKFLDRIFKDVY